MIERYLAAVVQLASGADKAANLQAAAEQVAAAAARGARLIALPELFDLMADGAAMAAAGESVPGPTSDRLADLARQAGVILLAGSIAERSERPGRFYNTSLLFSATGELLTKYRKIHRFDVAVPGRVTYRESAHVDAGDETVVATTPLGLLGLAICYDLRFPGLFVRLAAAGAQVLLIPSAFAEGTGRDHWEVLLRARAIENQCYVVAPNQCARHTPHLTTYGHSMIVDPWGAVLARVERGVGIGMAEIDLQRLSDIRAQLPALAHRLPRIDG